MRHITVIVGILLSATFAMSADYLQYVECHSSESTLSYYKDGAINVGGDLLSLIGLYQIGARYSRDPDTGELSYDGDFSVASSGLNVAQVSPGRFLYVARGYEDEIVVLDRAADGTVTLVQTVSDGVDGVDGIGNTLDVCVSPDGKNVYAVGQDDDAVAVFTRNITDGTLSFLEAHFDTDTGVDGLDGPRSVAITANGDFVYVGSGEDDAIAVFARDETTGSLSYSGMISNSDTGVSGLNYPVIIVIPPLTPYLYASGDGVTVLERDISTGALSFIEHLDLPYAYAMVAHPKAHRLYVASIGNDSVTVYETSESDGTLSELQTITNGVDGVTCLEDPSAIVMSPNAASLYVGTESGDIAVYSIAVSVGDFESGDLDGWDSSFSG